VKRKVKGKPIVSRYDVIHWIAWQPKIFIC
jgi:hypothetical protein